MRIGTGLFSSLKIESPKTDLRPTTSRVKESLANIITSKYIDFVEAKDCLELFSGSGQIGFELLSLGAKSIDMVEKSRDNIVSIKQTIKNHNFENIRVLNQDAFKFKSSKNYSLLFLDPPYNVRENEIEILLNRVSKNVDNCIILETGKRFKEISIVNYSLKDVRNYGTTTLWFWTKA